MKRLTISTVLAIWLGTSQLAFPFDPDALEPLRSKGACSNCDLSGANMAEVYLPGVILTNADLTGG